MKKSDKMNYDAPATFVVKMKAESVICVSTTNTLQNYTLNGYVEE